MTNRTHWSVAVTFGLIGTLLLHNYARAEEQPLELANLPELGTGELNSGGSALIVTTGTEKKTAYFRFGRNPTKSNRLKWDIAVETPYNRDKDPSIPADFDGLNNSTTIQGNLSGIWISEPHITNEFRAEMNNLCGKYLGKSAHQGGCGTGDLKKWIASLAQPLKMVLCERYEIEDCSALNEVWKQMYMLERELLRADLEDRDVIQPVKAFIGGIKAKVGKESFNYIDVSMSSPASSTETPFSISAYGNFMRGRWIFGGGAEYQVSYVEESQSNICTPTTPTGTLVCTNVRLGSPNEVKRKLVFADVHLASQKMSIAIAPRVTFDFEIDETGILIPVYLLRDDKGNLTGGVSIGWQSETEDLTASIFIGKAFSFWR